MKIRELKLMVLLLGFLGGNLFGTILEYLRKFFVWDGLIILTLILMSELISYISYKPRTRFQFLNYRFTNASKIKKIFRGHSNFFRSFAQKQKDLKKFTCKSCVRVPKVERNRCKSSIGKKTCTGKDFQGLENPLRNIIKYFYINGNKYKIWQSFFNFFKIGVMIGFFVDAFKVGS